MSLQTLWTNEKTFDLHLLNIETKQNKLYNVIGFGTLYLEIQAVPYGFNPIVCLIHYRRVYRVDAYKRTSFFIGKRLIKEQHTNTKWNDRTRQNINAEFGKSMPEYLILQTDDNTENTKDNLTFVFNSLSAVLYFRWLQYYDKMSRIECNVCDVMTFAKAIDNCCLCSTYMSFWLTKKNEKIREKGVRIDR